MNVEGCMQTCCASLCSKCFGKLAMTVWCAWARRMVKPCNCIVVYMLRLKCQGFSPRVGLSPHWLRKSQASKHLRVCVLAPWLTPPYKRVEAPRRGCVGARPSPTRAWSPDHLPSGTAGARRIRGVPDARSTLLCARALRPLAHPAAHSHAQGTRVASTAGTRKRPRAEA